MTNWKRWLYPAFKLAVVLLLVFFIRRTLVDAIEQIRGQSIVLDPKWLLLSGGLYVLGQFPSAVYWYLLIQALGQRPRFRAAMRAYYIGHLGKYVPGKALVVLLRAGFVKGSAVNVAVAAVCVFVETLTTMAVGGFLAGAILAVQFRDDWRWMALSFGLMIAMALPTAPPIFRKLVRLARVGKAYPDAVEALDRLHYGTLAIGWCLTAIDWMITGASLWAALRAIGLSDVDMPQHLPLCVAAIAMAVVVGFLSLIPGGAFVREFVLLRLLTQLPGVTEAMALLSAVVLRLVWVVTELIVAGLLYTLGRGFPRDHQDPFEVVERPG